MTTQAEIEEHAIALSRVRASRDNLLESFGVDLATVTTFNTGENSLGFEIDPNGQEIIIKANVALAVLGFYALPTVSVFEFEDDTLRIPNSDIRQPIDYVFLFEGSPGGAAPFLSTASGFPNRDGVVELGVKPFPLSPDYTYEYEGLAMEDSLIASFRTDFLANWRSASEIYAIIDVAEIGSRLPTPNVGDDVIIYSGPRPDVAADAIASHVFFGDTPTPDPTPDPEDPNPRDVETEGPDNILGTVQNDTVQGLGGDDQIKGQAGNDLLVGGAGDDRISGNGGDDRIRGNGGADTMKGNSGADVIRAGGGADIVKGGGGADQINGGGGNDLLLGGGGGDVISGKGGSDTLRGNGGADVFQFRASDRNDTILDFRQGQDKIEIQSGARSFAGLDLQQDGGDVLISFGTGQIRVETDSVDAFDDGDFVF